MFGRKKAKASAKNVEASNEATTSKASSAKACGSAKKSGSAKASKQLGLKKTHQSGEFFNYFSKDFMLSLYSLNNISCS